MTEMNDTLSTILGRKSVRAFRPDPVSRATLDTILQTAARSPSGNNMQPWSVHVATGRTRHALARDLGEAFASDTPLQPEYSYYPPQWRDPYLRRRRETGWALYETLGIRKGDREQSRAQHARNFDFFGAPVALFLALDADLGQGAWLDLGMFAQSLMLAAHGVGLATCPQLAVAGYPQVVRRHLHIPDDAILAFGISLGHEDAAHPVNQFRTQREALSDFARFYD